jgi:transposase-like protein
MNSSVLLSCELSFVSQRERGIDICHETVRHWWNRFGPMFAGDIRRKRMSRMRGFATGDGTSMRGT